MPRSAQAFALVATLAAALALAGPAGAGPAVAVDRAGAIQVLDEAGAVLRTFPSQRYYALDAGLLAREAPGFGIVVADAATGAQRFEVANATLPLLLGGRRLVFLGDPGGVRDPFATSVFIRRAGGRIERLVRFKAGPGLPGIATGMPDAGVALGLSADAGGTKVAVAFGNDVDLFFYDVWVVAVKTKAAFRATRGERSRFPDLAPSGKRLVFLREEESCGGPPPGFRAGDLVLMPARKGGRKTTLAEGSCAVFYTEPHWLSNGEVVAVRLTRTSPGEYESDLVLLDAATKAVTPLPGTDGAFGLSVSPGLRAVGYMRESGSYLLDVGAARTLELPGAWGPELDGDRHW